MGSSFNLELSKYLDKRKQPPSEKKSAFQRIINQIPFFYEVHEFLKTLKEKEEFVDIQDNSRSVHVVENEPFFKKLVRNLNDFFFMKKTEDLEVDVESSPEEKKEETEKIQPRQIQEKSENTKDTAERFAGITTKERNKQIFDNENFFSKNKEHDEKGSRKSKNLFSFLRPREKAQDVVEVQEEPDNKVDNLIDNYSKEDRERNKTFSNKELDYMMVGKDSGMQQEKIHHNTENTDENNVSYNKVMLFKPEIKDDLKYILQVTFNLVKKVPRPALEEFKNSEEYQKYVSLLRKYDIIKKKEKD